MTSTSFFLRHREMVIELAAHNTLSETWRLLTEQTDIESVMKENSFRGRLPPFLETSRFYADELNKQLHNQQELHEKLHNEQELNERLHNQLRELHEEQELNEKLYNDERLNEKLHENQELNEKLQISGWTIGKSGKSGEYYRAFRKVSGKVHAIHLGRHLDLIDAKIKIDFKSEQLFSARHTNTATDT